MSKNHEEREGSLSAQTTSSSNNFVPVVDNMEQKEYCERSKVGRGGDLSLCIQDGQWNSASSTLLCNTAMPQTAARLGGSLPEGDVSSDGNAGPTG
jgi:hypothetical protein